MTTTREAELLRLYEAASKAHCRRCMLLPDSAERLISRIVAAHEEADAAFRAALTTALGPTTKDAPLFHAAVEGMLEGLRDNPSAHTAASISGIASAALAALSDAAKADREEILKLLQERSDELDYNSTLFEGADCGDHARHLDSLRKEVDGLIEKIRNRTALRTAPQEGDLLGP